jgi:probable HAF family extracellular repeat protein
MLLPLLKTKLPFPKPAAKTLSADGRHVLTARIAARYSTGQMQVRFCALLTLLLGGTHHLAADVLYSVTDLGTLGGSLSYGEGINDLGQVTGFSYKENGVDRAFLYSNGQMRDLGSLGGSSSEGYGINDLGQVTGWTVVTGSGAHAFLYSDGQMRDLGTLVGSGIAFVTSIGQGINNLGQVTGGSQTNPDGPFDNAFLYSDGQMRDLGFLGAGFSINDHGQVTGLVQTGGYDYDAFLYSNGQMHDLGSLGGFGFNSSGQGINNLGQITGWTDLTGSRTHAFLYSDGQMHDLGTLVGSDIAGVTSEGYGINDLGQVTAALHHSQRNVGGSSGIHAFLCSDGQMLDLNNLIDPALGVTLDNATGINDNGQIVANGDDHAYLLTPVAVPEPGTLTLFGGLLLAVAYRARKRLRRGC